MTKSDTTNISQAAKQNHDEELQRMEADIAKQLAGDAPETPESENQVTATETDNSNETSATQDKPQDADTSATHGTEAEPTAQPTVKPETHDDSDDLDVSQLSEKAQKRFRKMSEKIRQLEAQSIKQKYEAPKVPVQTTATAPTTPGGYKLPWETGTTEQQPDVREISEEEFQAQVEAKARAAVQSELRTEKILSQVTQDTQDVETRYPQLNPQSDSYDEVLVAKVSSWFKALWRQNHDLRLKDFVDEVMTLQAKGAEQGRSEVTGKVLRQAAEQAMGPGMGSGRSTSAMDAIKSAKTLDELEAAERLI